MAHGVQGGDQEHYLYLLSVLGANGSISHNSQGLDSLGPPELLAAKRRVPSQGLFSWHLDDPLMAT